jgi:hypothetical protein
LSRKNETAFFMAALPAVADGSADTQLWATGGKVTIENRIDTASLRDITGFLSAGGLVGDDTS